MEANKQPLTNIFLNTAIEYHKQGIICMPVKETKNPNLAKYTEFNKEPTSLDVVKDWPWDSAFTKGVGMFTGHASGDMIVLDFDTKYDITGDLFERWKAQLPESLLERFVIAGSRSGGKHVYFRCPGSTTKNIKLANRHTTYQERDKNPNELVKVLIETRGNGGIIVCAPTPGYTWLQGDQTSIPTITPEEELLLLDTCRGFNEVIIEVRPKMVGTDYKLTSDLSPSEDYDNKADVNGLLMSHGWDFSGSKGSKDHYKRPGDSHAKTSGNYDHDLKWFSVFTTSSQFETNKAYRPWMVYAVLEHGGDYKAAYIALRELGYGKMPKYDPKVINKLKEYLENGNDKSITEYLDLCFQDRAIAAAHLGKANEPIITIPNSFWSVEVDDKGKDKVVINASALVGFMATNGFYKHYPSGNIEPVYIRIENSIASEININQIVDFITDYILSLPYEFDGINRTRLYNCVFHSSGSYFSDSKIPWLRENKQEFIRDTENSAFVFFKNCIVEVTAGGDFSQTDYSALGNCIVWKHQVKDHNFEYEDPAGCVFQKFIQLISAGKGRYETNTKILGYLMHRYKNPAKAYAIIGCEDIENADQGGGTGKSLIATALSKMVPTTFIEGKNFDTNRSFAWQAYSLGDSLVNIDDLNQKFSIEQINSQITAGFTLERKNKPSVVISAEDSPKFYMTTNHNVDESAVHAQRRIRKLIVTPFFGKEKKPDHYFGHLFFSGWNESEWNKFYSFMLVTISDYLKDNEIESAESDILIVKAFNSRYSSELSEFLENASMLETYREKQSVKDYWYPNFLSFSGQDNRTYSMKKFSQGLKEAAESKLLFLTLKSVGGSRTSEYFFN